jgi:hypothetical protein
VFGTSAGSNVINTDVNPVLNINDVKRPAQGKYLYAITLPLPTSVSSWCWTGKDHGEFFANPPLVLKDLARVHVFEYADYDLGGLAINGTPIQLPIGDTHIKILSEPLSQITAARECLRHSQRANKAIGDMIQVKNGIMVNEGYCHYTTSLRARSKGVNKDPGDGGGIHTLSRYPACVSMFANATGSGLATGRRQHS